MGCTGFTGDLILPQSLEIIGSSSFSGCSNFSGTLTIPSSVHNIGASAFFGCTGFTDIIFSNSQTEVGIYSFYKVNVKCFDYVPSSMKQPDQKIYSSTGFGGRIFSLSSYNLECHTFYILDDITYYFSIIFSSGVISILLIIITKLVIKPIANGF